MKKAAVPSIPVAVVLVALGVTAEAQQPKKVPRIGYLSALNPANESTRAEGIRLALASVATSKDRISPSSAAEGKPIGLLSLRAELISG
jgi:hypothetical protein